MGLSSGNTIDSQGRAGKIRNTAVYYAAFIILGMVAAIIGPSLGRLAQQTSTSLGHFSLIFVARSLGYLVGSLLGGHLSDRIPGHWVMAADLGAIAVLLVLLPLTTWFWLLMLLMFILGLVGGALDVGGNTLLVWVHREQVGPFMNGLHFFFGLGAFISPVFLAQSITRSGDIRWGLWALALLALPVMLAALSQASPQRLSRPDKPTAGKTNWLLLSLIVLFFFFFAGSEHAFSDWIASYARGMGLADEVGAAYLTSLFWGALTVGRLLGIPISAWLRPRLILFLDLVGSLLSLLLMVAFPHSMLAAQVGSVGAGLAMASVFPTLLTFAGRRMLITGQVTSFFFVGSSLGAMFLPWLIGRLFEPLGPQVATISILVDLLLVLGVLVWLMRVSASPSLPVQGD